MILAITVLWLFACVFIIGWVFGRITANERTIYPRSLVYRDEFKEVEAVQLVKPTQRKNGY